MLVIVVACEREFEQVPGTGRGRGQALEEGGGGSSDWTSSEKEQIRNALGVDGTKTDATGGKLQNIEDTSCRKCIDC